MNKHAFVLVGFEPDWEALYVESVKVAEGPRVSTAECIKHSLALAEKLRTTDFEMETTHVETDEMDEHGEIEIPDRLGGLPKGAYERISA